MVPKSLNVCRAWKKLVLSEELFIYLSECDMLKSLARLSTRCISFFCCDTCLGHLAEIDT